MKTFLSEFADDAETLARLHDRELDAATLIALKEIGFPDNLALLPQDEESRAAWQFMRNAVSSAPTFREIDELAAEYAAIYLTGSYGISPCESVWLDEDRLTCREPMFALREIYKAAGLAAADWRKRPDDHLVLQLLFIAHALHPAASANFLVQMMDEHLLRWLPDFSARVATRTSQPFYAGLGMLTLAWCRELRIALNGCAAAGFRAPS